MVLPISGVRQPALGYRLQRALAERYLDCRYDIFKSPPSNFAINAAKAFGCSFVVR